ncbi:MAG: hypothetical protein HY645_12980 [Acidobacteria bacterium]|nr:hypothetical protein [Acidobacteriota bacterium]
MKRLWKSLSVLSALSILVATSAVFAQTPGYIQPNYGGWVTSLQTRNIPAGTVVDPGSQLLYIVDTGINLRTSTISAADLAAKNVNQLLNITGADGEIQRNFISVTNTHPTQAVTIHFRYFNDQCEDLLDFLVILTCNDTLLLDPFNFTIPAASLGGNPINTKSRIFGPDLSADFPAIKGNRFLSGRFLIFATAAGTSTDADDDAEILFPKELAPTTLSTTDPCWNFRPTSGTGTSTDPFVNNRIGSAAGLSASNLHVFNATAVSFNYLIGHQTTAVPKGFIVGAQSDQDKFLAWGVNAWTRPAVNLVLEAQGGAGNINDGHGDGDGWQAGDSNSTPLLFKILTGSEVNTKQSDTATNLTTNYLYLRNEVHGGDTFRAVSGAVPSGATTTLAAGTGVGGGSHYGALGWTSLHTADNRNQRVELLSIVDDYDGSKNTAVAATVSGVEIRDRSYNLTGAQTRYILQIYDNKEQKLSLIPGQPINISPPPTVAPTANLRIIVDCLQVWINGVIDATTRRDGLSIHNLGEIAATVLTGSGSFAGLNATITPTSDASQGWIRFVRDNNQTRTRNFSTSSTAYNVTITAGTIAPIDPTIMDNAFTPSFVTIGQVVLKFEGFGASWWLASAAHDLAVSNASITNPSP